MKDYVNWAILAPGTIAASMAKAMMETAKTDKRIRLYAVASRDLARAKEFADKWGFSKAYGSYEELINDSEVDAVYIANPHSFHFDSTMACLKGGKHVLCEKPAGCNIMQLDQMIECAQKNNRFFMEAMWTAFNPCMNQVCKFIKDGGLGELMHIESRFCNRIPYDPKGRMWAPELAGGALLDLGIYNIYVSSMLNDFSPVKTCQSIVKMYKDVDAWESVNLTYENSVLAVFQAACDRPSGRETHDAIVFGTRGYITIEHFFYTQKAVFHEYCNQSGGETKIAKEFVAPFNVNGYEYEMIHATECILAGKSQSDVHTFQKSRELCKTMDCIRKEWGMVYPFEK